MATASTQPKVAVLIFAQAQQRDQRRRGLSSNVGTLLSLPKLNASVPGADLHWFCDRPVRGVAMRDRLTIHRQQGKTFSQRFENAVEQLSAAGYEKIVIVGRDCPQLTGDDVNRAIELLDSRRLVVGPDHRGGCWLIAIHAADREKLRGVRWQCDTDAAELMQRFADSACAMLPARIDVDTAADLRLLRTYFACLRFLVLHRATGANVHLTLTKEQHFLRRQVQCPPPVVHC